MVVFSTCKNARIAASKILFNHTLQKGVVVMSYKMVLDRVEKKVNLVKIKFENVQQMFDALKELNNIISGNEKSFAKAFEDSVFSFDKDKFEIYMHISTLLRISNSFWEWAKINYKNNKLTFPRLVIDENFKPTLQKLVEEKPINIDKNVKDDAFIISELTKLGMNKDLSLYDHQIFRVKEFALENKKVDCSIMGSGKTVVAIANYILHAQNKSPLLVICPLNVIDTWVSEIKLWAPNLNVHVIRHGISRNDKDKAGIEKKSILNDLSKNPDVIIINYDKLGSVSPALLEHYLPLGIKLACVCDEAHKLKNEKTRNFLNLQTIMPILHSKMKWAATGTPMPKDENDLKSLVKIFSEDKNPNAFDVREKFLDMMSAVPPSALNLPEMKQEIVYANMIDIHADLYKSICHSTKKDIDAYGSDIVQIEKCIQRVMMFLSFPLNPNLQKSFPHIFQEIKEKGHHGAKIDKLLELVEQKIPNGKIVVWTNWVNTLNYIYSEFEKLGYNPAKIDGSLCGPERTAQIKKFKNDPTCKIMVANPRAGGEGISLHKISNCAIFLDLTYNFAHKFQAEKRIHRCGLSEDANVETYYIVATCDGRQTLDGDTRTTRKTGILANLFDKQQEHDALMEDHKKRLLKSDDAGESSNKSKSKDPDLTDDDLSAFNRNSDKDQINKDIQNALDSFSQTIDENKL